MLTLLAHLRAFIKYAIAACYAYLFIYQPLAAQIKPRSDVMVWRANVVQLHGQCRHDQAVAVKDGVVVGLGDPQHLARVLNGTIAKHVFEQVYLYRKLSDSQYQWGEQVPMPCGPWGLNYQPLVRLGSEARFYLLDQQHRVVGYVHL